MKKSNSLMKNYFQQVGFPFYFFHNEFLTLRKDSVIPLPKLKPNVILVGLFFLDGFGPKVTSYLY